MVKDLREKTGAGMMDCKKALAESAGDFAKAEEWLRKKGISKAASKGSRIAAEGLLGYLVHRRAGGAGRGELRDRLRRAQPRLHEADEGLRRARGQAQPGRRGGAARAELGEGRQQEGERRADRRGGEDRREHHRSPLQPLRARLEGGAGRLPPRRHPQGRAGGDRRRQQPRRGQPGEGAGDAGRWRPSRSTSRATRCRPRCWRRRTRTTRRSCASSARSPPRTGRATRACSARRRQTRFTSR